MNIYIYGLWQILEIEIPHLLEIKIRCMPNRVNARLGRSKRRALVRLSHCAYSRVDIINVNKEDAINIRKYVTPILSVIYEYDKHVSSKFLCSIFDLAHQSGLFLCV